MPYGIPADKGGESLENTAKMEACITDVMDKGSDKETAIRECKVSLGFTKDKGSRRNA